MPEKTPRTSAIEKENYNRQLLLNILEHTRAHREGYPEDVIMVHATSVESLAELVKTGKLPGRSFRTSKHKRGDLFVYPIPDRFPDKENPSAWVRSHTLHDMASDDIIDYANEIAPRHYLLSILKIPQQDVNRVRAIDQFLAGNTPRTMDDEEIRDAMNIIIEDAGSEEHLARHIANARLRQGVVIGIKRSALVKHGFAIGDPGHADFKLVTGRNGLSIDDIGSIELLGPEGYDFFESLRNK